MQNPPLPALTNEGTGKKLTSYPPAISRAAYRRQPSGVNCNARSMTADARLLLLSRRALQLLHVGDQRLRLIRGHALRLVGRHRYGLVRLLTLQHDLHELVVSQSRVEVLRGSSAVAHRALGLVSGGCIGILARRPRRDG